MLKVTLKNGNEYELLEDTTVYPSGSPNARSRMEIHMGEDAMTTAEFERQNLKRLLWMRLQRRKSD